MKFNKKIIAFCLFVTALHPQKPVFAGDNDRHLRHFDSVFVTVDMPHNLSRGAFKAPIGKSDLLAMARQYLSRSGISLASNKSPSTINLDVELYTDSARNGHTLYSCSLDVNLDMNFNGESVALAR